MTTFTDSILFIANGITQQSHSGDTISISRNLTIASPSTFSVGVNLNFASGFAPSIVQTTATGTGANAGTALTVQSQAGQSVTSGTNNNGGNLILNAGAQGTGGSGGVAGNVILQTGGSPQVTVSPTQVTVASIAGSGRGLVATDDSGNLSFIASNSFLFKPGATAAGNVYTDWSSLMSAVSLANGAKNIVVDGYLATPYITSGTWDVGGCTISGLAGSDGFFPTIIVNDGAVLTFDFLRLEYIGVTSNSTSSVCVFDGGAGCALSVYSSVIISPTTPFFDIKGAAGAVTLLCDEASELGDETNPILEVESPAIAEVDLSNHSILFSHAISGTGAVDVSFDSDATIQSPQDITTLTYFPQSKTSQIVGSVGGDVSGAWVGNGTNPSLTVIKIQGNPVAAQTLDSSTDGYVLSWDNTDGYWRAGPAGSTSIVALTGDVTGYSNSNTVIKVDGVSYPASPTTNTVPVVTASNTVTYQQIADAQISATANVSVSKLASGSAAQFLLSNATPTATWTTMSGDGYLSSAGALTVVSLSGESNQVVVNAGNLVWQNSVVFPEISQLNLASGNSSTAGQPFSIIPQNGQNALSGTTNGGNGGNLLLSSGMGGTPTGGGTAGTSGNIQLQLGAATLITYTSNFETWASTAIPTITQSSTSAAPGATFTVQAQNATGVGNTGGNLVLAGGTSGSATAGIVQLQTAGTTRLTVGATGVITIANLSTGIVHADSSGNLTSSAVNLASGDVTGILPAANQAAQTMGGDVTGTTASNTVTALQHEPVHADTLSSSTDGYVLTWDNTDGYWTARPISATTSVTLSGDVTGASNSNTVVKINGTSVPASPSSAQILIAQSGTSSQWKTISQDATIATTGAITVVSANGNFLVNGITTATGGVLTTSVDTATATTLNLGTTTATKVQIGTSGNLTEVLGNLKVDGAETIVGTSTFQAAVSFDGNVTVADGYSFTVVGATAGNYSINGATASSLTTNSGASLTITAGAASTWSTAAGALTLNGNTGLNLQTGGTTIASTNANQFIFNGGIRRTVRTVTAGTAITAADDIISVGTLSGPATMTLPTSPTVGDAYTIKDKVGGATTNSITLDSSGGNKIDAAQTFVMDVNYAAVDVVCVATSPNQWSIM